MWHSRLRVWHCHCSSSGHCCDVGLIPGLGTSACCGCGPPPKKIYSFGNFQEYNTVNCNYSLLTIITTLSIRSPELTHLLMGNLYPLTKSPNFPTSYSLASTILLFFCEFRFLDPTYVREHTVFVFLCLTYFT